MKIKTLILDIDGTLTIDRKSPILSIEALSAIRKLVMKKSHVNVGLATGNAHIVAYALGKYIGLKVEKGPIISENGCILWFDGKEYRLGDENYTRQVYELILKEFSRYVKPSYQSAYRKIDHAFYIIHDNPEEIIKKIIEYLEEKSYLKYVDIKFSGYAGHVIPKGVDKGLAIKKYSELSGISLDEIAAIGDSETDISMIRIAGLGVAVSNASEELKKVAKYVTREPSGRGVAEFIHWLLSNDLV